MLLWPNEPIYRKITPDQIADMVNRYKKNYSGFLPRWFSRPGEGAYRALVQSPAIQDLMRGFLTTTTRDSLGFRSVESLNYKHSSKTEVRYTSDVARQLVEIFAEHCKNATDPLCEEIKSFVDQFETIEKYDAHFNAAAAENAGDRCVGGYYYDRGW